VIRQDDIDQLHALIAWEGNTIRMIHGWLLERGYRVSRNATWRYMRHVRCKIAGASLLTLKSADEDACRALINETANRLKGSELVYAAGALLYLHCLGVRRKAGATGVDVLPPMADQTPGL